MELSVAEVEGLIVGNRHKGVSGFVGCPCYNSGKCSAFDGDFYLCNLGKQLDYVDSFEGCNRLAIERDNASCFGRRVGV